MSIRERITEKLANDIALYDCQGDCPDEVALNEDLRTPEYCNKCFSDQILTYLKAEIEKSWLTDEEIDQIYFECGKLNKPSLHYLNERIDQAQIDKVLKLLEE